MRSLQKQKGCRCVWGDIFTDGGAAPATILAVCALVAQSALDCEKALRLSRNLCLTLQQSCAGKHKLRLARRASPWVRDGFGRSRTQSHKRGRRQGQHLGNLRFNGRALTNLHLKLHQSRKLMSHKARVWVNGPGAAPIQGSFGSGDSKAPAANLHVERLS